MPQKYSNGMLSYMTYLFILPDIYHIKKAIYLELLIFMTTFD